jgi:hypothetical protein
MAAERAPSVERPKPCRLAQRALVERKQPMARHVGNDDQAMLEA